MTWNVILPLILLFLAYSANGDPIESESELYSVTFINVYVFNWTNPEDIYSSIVKPKFEEVGPFRYKKIRQKINNTHVLDNYYFDEENSSSHESDVITTFNMVPWVLMYSAKDQSYFVRLSYNMMLQSTDCQMYVQKSIRELMFEGYVDPILDIVRQIPVVPTELSDRFGWFYGKNGSTSPLEDYYLSDLKEESKVILYSNTENSTYDFQEIVKSNTILFHTPETCDPIILKEDDDKDNSTYKYQIGSSSDQAETFIYHCDENTPVYTSSPHFLQTNSSYKDAIEGLQPDKARHGTYIKFDVESGAVLENKVRLQTNILLQPVDAITLYEKVPEIMLPVFWIEHILV